MVGLGERGERGEEGRALGEDVERRAGVRLHLLLDRVGQRAEVLHARHLVPLRLDLPQLRDVQPEDVPRLLLV